MGAAPEVQLDAEATIAEFIKDAGSASLEFPPMPAGQRKHVKAIADTYPSLVCESFGIGSERCIHIFKRDYAKDGAGSVSVKNTFIDDWITPVGGEDALEPVVFRSMPSQLPDSAARLPDAVGVQSSKLDLSPINEGSPKFPLADAFSLQGQKQVDGYKSLPVEERGSGGVRSSADALPTLLGGFKVRNTFIHIDTVSPDDRSVQSMPHDMFRQCLQEEMTRIDVAGTACEGQDKADASADIHHAPQQDSLPRTFEGSNMFKPGTQVIIQGLTKIPAFNGQSGIVERLDETTGRYSVKLTTGGPGIPKFAKVKADNLCVLALSSPVPLTSTCTMAQGAVQAYFGSYCDTSESVGANPTTQLKLTALV